MHARWRGLNVALGSGGSRDESPWTSKAPVSAGTRDAAERIFVGLRREPEGSERLAVQGEVARGGMGTVFEVWDLDLRRSLAMKVLAKAPDRRLTSRALARFLEEAQITGQLEHPGIVPVHELGIDAEGRAYFTMRLVRGESLQAVIERVHRAEPDMPLTRALGLFVSVCDTVGYAHSKGVLHRDLKPSNVMVGAFGELYVMDWGLARVLDASDPEVATADLRTVRSEAGDARSAGSPWITMEGDVIGTPVYMSPEQAHGRVDEVGPRSDVYSIGAMLYHLLTGQRPYLTGAPDSDSTDAVLEAVRSRPPTPVHELVADVPAELESICERAMARDPMQRYAGTMELAGDLRAFLEGRTVSAYPTGAWAELRKWIERNRRLAQASAIAALSLVGGLAASTWLFLDSRANARRLALEVRTSEIQLGRLHAKSGAIPHAEELLWPRFFERPDDPEAHWALWELHSHAPCRMTLDAGIGANVGLALSPDRSLLAVYGPADSFATEGRIRLWDADRFEELVVLEGHTGPIHAADFDPENRLLATASGDGTVGLFDLAARARVGTLVGDGPALYAVRFHPHGRRLVSGNGFGALLVWDVAARTRAARLEGPARTINALCFDPSGSLLASAEEDGTVRLWRDLEREVAVLSAHQGGVIAVEFSPDGALLASGGRDRSIHLWDLATYERRASIPATNGQVMDLLFARGGKELLVAGTYGLETFAVADLALLRTLRAATAFRSLVQDRHGRILTTNGPTLRVWEHGTEAMAMRFPEHEGRVQATFDASGDRLVTGDASGRMRVWDARSATLERELCTLSGPVGSLRLDPSGTLVAAGTTGELRIVELASGATLRTFDRYVAYQNDADFDPRGGSIAFACSSGSFEVRDLETGELRAFLPAQEEALCVRYLDGGASIVTLNRDYRVRVWSSEGELRADPAHDFTWWEAEPSRDGRWLACASFGRTIELLDARTLEPTKVLRGHAGIPWSSDWHPSDRNLLATAAADGTARLWDVASGRSLLTLEAFEGAEAHHVEFDPTGNRLLVAGHRGQIAIFDLRHFDQHIAGNLRYQLGRLRPELRERVDEARLEAWLERRGVR